MSGLLEPVVIGNRLPLRNRVVMSSMTRNRCIDYRPGPAQVQHYADRARDGTGLLISEGIFVDWVGCDWQWTPFMISVEDAIAWSKVTSAVHEAGGKIFFQAWHPGRLQHDEMPLMKEKGGLVLAPSNIPGKGGKYRDLPGMPGHTHNITEIENPADIVATYVRAVTLAKKAGFDGVELLAQGGYLPQQFLSSLANKRTDGYGGSVQNRCRFILEVVEAIANIFNGPEMICVKICPVDDLENCMVTFEESKEVYGYLIKELVARRVGIIHLCRRGGDYVGGYSDYFSRAKRHDEFPIPKGYDPVLDFGPIVRFPGSQSMLMANHDYSVQEADRLVKEGRIDLIAFGRPFIYNPDVINRIRNRIPLAINSRGKTVHYGPYTTPDENYNDWPASINQESSQTTQTSPIEA